LFVCFDGDWNGLVVMIMCGIDEFVFFSFDIESLEMVVSGNGNG
jgi:hypothetical protein